MAPEDSLQGLHVLLAAAPLQVPLHGVALGFTTATAAGFQHILQHLQRRQEGQMLVS